MMPHEKLLIPTNFAEKQIHSIRIYFFLAQFGRTSGLTLADCITGPSVMVKKVRMIKDGAFPGDVR